MYKRNKTFTNAFNSYSYLGPTLILNKGDFVSLTGENQLMDTSTVHWHGLHVPAVADGGPHTVILPNTSWLAQFTVKKMPQPIGIILIFTHANW
ncbi:MAG: multicopper oxidase domain-containing protein [Saprospiraceae bacterium]|nr:multicopper oxidase domain-containing protein [Candidatus Brachybacter algidus]